MVMDLRPDASPYVAPPGGMGTNQLDGLMASSLLGPPAHPHFDLDQVRPKEKRR